MEENVPLEACTAMRFILAAVITLPWLFLGKGNDANAKTEVVIEQEDSDAGILANVDLVSSSSWMASYGAIIGGAEVGFWNWIGYITQAIGLQSTPAGANAFICSLSVVVVPFLDFLIGKKVLSREIVGALLAVMGVGFLEMNGLQENILSGQPIVSHDMFYSLLQPLAFGVAYWRMEYYTRRFGDSGMKLTSSQLLTIALLMTGNLIFMNGGSIPDSSLFISWLSNPIVLQSILWTGIVTTALTIYIETQALKTLSASETSLLYSTEPIFGSVVAAAVLGESFGVQGGVGAALILGGCLYSSLGFNDD